MALLRRLVEAAPAHNLDSAGSTVTLDVPNPYRETLAETSAALTRDDFGEVAKLAPIRDSAALARIRVALKMKDGDDYQVAARTLVKRDADLVIRLRVAVGTLP